ncbi:MAG: molybdopterin-synthase adenylyltransferase MoeB [Crocinitomicaceae bacterium]
MSLTSDEIKQYNRHLILNEIGFKGQVKLKEAKVLIIGAGGLGCPILQYLTAAGVGTIGIIDHDVVSISNLQRQILYTHQDIGKYKVTTAISQLQQLNPNVEFIPYLEELTHKNALQLFEQYDIIVDGSDNFPTRYLANDASVLTKKPLVFGAIYKFEGQVSVFNYKNGPTYRCLFPNPPGPNEVPNCSQIGVLGVLPGIIGSFQANEVIKIITENGKVLNGELLSYNTLTHEQLKVSFSKNSSISLTKLETDYELFCGIMENTFELEYDTIKSNLDKYHLIDVREEWEREEFNIGGIHISVYDLINQLDLLKTDKPILLYCQSGNRSSKGRQLLEDLLPGREVFTLKDGISGLE